VSAGFSFFLSIKTYSRQLGEGRSLLISDLNSLIKYEGGAKTRRHMALCGMSLTQALEYLRVEIFI
jgi:hypothetical protein